MTTTFIVRSGPGPDANGNITDMEGWDLARYQANPVVLWDHQESIPPIGKATRVAIHQAQLVADIEFTDTELAKTIERLISNRMINATSARWLPITWTTLRDEKGWTTGIHSHQQALIELSIVNIPADPAALRAHLNTNGTTLSASPALYITDPPPCPTCTQGRQDHKYAIALFEALNGVLRGAP